jgi:DNA-binding response OmpR family regulator
MKKKIFVIDDDSLALQTIAGALEAEGHEVAVFSNFESLLHAARRTLPDVVMTDVVMPEMNGFDICRKIKEMFRPDPPLVIVMTGKLDAVDPVLARQMGADDFVVKTSDMGVLVQAVRKIFPEKGPS